MRNGRPRQRPRGPDLGGLVAPWQGVPGHAARMIRCIAIISPIGMYADTQHRTFCASMLPLSCESGLGETGSNSYAGTYLHTDLSHSNATDRTSV